MMKLTKKQILSYQQNQPPYLMVDFITKVIPGKLSEGYKKLPKNEWFFKVHWKNNPNMPGALQFQSIVQTCSLALFTLPNNKKKILYIVEASELKFYKKVVPGKNLVVKSRILNLIRGVAFCEGKGYQNNVITCSAKFKVILPDEIKKFKVK